MTVDNTVDPARDMEVINLELILADIAQVVFTITVTTDRIRMFKISLIL